MTDSENLKLGEKQWLFAELYAGLIIHAVSLGFTCALNECSRSDEQSEINALGSVNRSRLADLIRPLFPSLASAIRNNGKNNGIRNSAHQRRLAGDLLLFKDGVYLTKSEDYRPLGEWWISQHPLCRWGGDWGDGNHFSIEHDGVK